jgi:hypothetical protein
MGNTEVYRPLHSIFLLKPENSLRNIFVISDGHVNNEETTLKAVHDNCQHTRVITTAVISSRLIAGTLQIFLSL